MQSPQKNARHSLDQVEVRLVVMRELGCLVFNVQMLAPQLRLDCSACQAYARSHVIKFTEQDESAEVVQRMPFNHEQPGQKHLPYAQTPYLQP
eukprot:1249517-Amphidinium_carterae.1